MDGSIGADAVVNVAAIDKPSAESAAEVNSGSEDNAETTVSSEKLWTSFRSFADSGSWSNDISIGLSRLLSEFTLLS